MPDYVEVCWFESGVFAKRQTHSSPKARTIFQQSIDKFAKGKDKVIVQLRHENHALIQAWTNLTDAEVGTKVTDYKKRGWSN